MEFTHDVERDDCISFFDVTVVNMDRCFETCLFRKETLKGLSTKYSIAEPSRYKINMIWCVITRAYKICSNILRFKFELDFLIKFFVQNWFPGALVNSMMGKFVDFLRLPKHSVLTVEKVTILGYPFH